MSIDERRCPSRCDERRCQREVDHFGLHFEGDTTWVETGSPILDAAIAARLSARS